MGHIKPRVLVLDADMITCLSIVRSLAKRHIICDIAVSAGTKTLARYSRHVDKVFQYPNPLTEAEAFVDFIDKHLQQHAYDLVIPVTERSVVPLASTNKLEQWAAILAIAPRDSLNKVLDKKETMALATQCEVSVPFSYAVDSVDDIKKLLPKLSFPVVLKPGRSIPNADTRKQLSVTYAFDENELLGLGTDLLKCCQLLLQQYTKGVGTGIELLADHGEMVYAFQHQRLHELPLTGGGSCFRKSMALNPVLLEAAGRLIKAFQWHGVAMVEFKWQPETGNYWLMEINGRFWGSLPLACAAGADFPWLLYQLLVKNERPSSTGYQDNVYCRKLSSDIYWYEQVIRRSYGERLVEYPSNRQLLKDALWVLHPYRHAFDVQQWGDPMPGLVDIAQIAKEYYRRFSGLLWLKWQYKKHRSLAMQKRLDKQLMQAKSVLFVCYGNINRSVLAQVLAEKWIANDKVAFDSAGFHDVPDRPVDVNMLKIAAGQGIDMSGCRSKTVNKTMMAQYDVIFVMEIRQFERIKTEYPEVANNTFLLGALDTAQTSGLEIDDPYNKGIPVYKDCFKAIASMIHQLVDKISVIT